MFFMAKILFIKQGSGNRRYPCRCSFLGIGEISSCQCPDGISGSDALWLWHKSEGYTCTGFCTKSIYGSEVRFRKKWKEYGRFLQTRSSENIT
jgi:hypothetical protein